MIYPFKLPFITPVGSCFWASPESTMSAVANWGSLRSERNALSQLKVTPPESLRGESPERPAPPTLPEFPTDVPVPEPHDFPPPEPVDPPAPDPGKSPPAPNPDPKPRPVP